jgi:hypothetical protein
MRECLNARMQKCEMTEWCVAILIKIYQNNEGTEQNFARLLQMLIRSTTIHCEASSNANQNH